MESISDDTSSGSHLLRCSWFEVPSLAVPFHNDILFMYKAQCTDQESGGSVEKLFSV